MDSGSDGDGAKPSDVTSEGVGGEGVGGEGVRGEGVEMPPYFSRVNCAKILMELQLHDVRCHAHMHTHTHAYTHAHTHSRGGQHMLFSGPSN